MAPPRPRPDFCAATNRRLALVAATRRERVQRVVEFMDRVAGRGWKHRMEMRDRYMDQDYPTMWLSGRKLVSRVNLLKLEAYAIRFGFVPEVADVQTSNHDVRQILDTALLENLGPALATTSSPHVPQTHQTHSQ